MKLKRHLILAHRIASQKWRYIQRRRNGCALEPPGLVGDRCHTGENAQQAGS